mgnify:FL=1
MVEPSFAVSLLNVYFVPKYGNGEWVSGYHNGQIFLNHKLIKDNGIDPKTIRTEAADLLLRMSGISRVWTIDDIEAGRAGHNADALKRNTQVDYAGDVFIEVTPGWEIVDQNPNNQKEVRSTVRTGFMSSPVFFLSPDLKAERITSEIDARTIAPTVARLLRIRSPNASELPPMRFNR